MDARVLLKAVQDGQFWRVSIEPIKQTKTNSTELV